LTRIRYVGHATVLIEAGGTALLTDPVLRTRIGHLRRLVPVAADERLESPDAVLISHAHHDHMDLQSLARVARECPVLAPRGCGRSLSRRGLRVTELEPGERARIGELEVVAAEARHHGRRHPLWRGKTTLCYIVEGPERVFFAGDTDLFDGMRSLGGGLDLALLPVWGWGSRLGPGHLDPERAAQAAALLRPGVAVPIHWGTLAAPRVPWLADPGAPAREFAQHLSRLAPEIDARVLAPGEQLTL
jgi:L-ascorbate metabolism protein UlaG (beta-lactamase superfamily)